MLYSKRQVSPGQLHLPMRQAMSYTMLFPVLPCATFLQLPIGVSALNSEEDGSFCARYCTSDQVWSHTKYVWIDINAYTSSCFLCKALLKGALCIQSCIKAPSIMGWKIPMGCAETKTPKTPSPMTDRQQVVPESVCQTTPSFFIRKELSKEEFLKNAEEHCGGILTLCVPCEMARPGG